MEFLFYQTELNVTKEYQLIDMKELGECLLQLNNRRTPKEWKTVTISKLFKKTNRKDSNYHQVITTEINRYPFLSDKNDSRLRQRQCRAC